MSDSAARAQRAAALEEKRRRLEELKARRTNRVVSKPSTTTSSNLDEYIDDLLRNPVAPGTGSAVASAGAAVSGTSSHSATSIPDGSSNDVAKGGNESVDKALDGGDGTTTSTTVTSAAAVAPVVPVKQVETFTVSTQTMEDDFPIPSTTERQDDEQEGTGGMDDSTKDMTGSGGDGGGGTSGAEETKEEFKDHRPKVLSSAEVEKEVTSPSFSTFLNTASKKVERMLGTPVLADLLVDFVGEMDGVKRHTKKVSHDASRFLASRQVYEYAKWTSNRDVTDVDWSHLHRELMLSTYSLSSSSNIGINQGGSATTITGSDASLSSSLTPRNDGELQSDGLALVWSLAMPKRPEHIFTCGSSVTTGKFHPTEPALLIGACQSGQIVVWDIRAGRLPVQRSSLTATVGASKGHTHPVCSMEVVEGGSGLVTADTDGRVNFWSVGSLREPAESLQVADSLSCFTVAPESETLLFGDGNGGLHAVPSASTSQGQRSSRRAVRKLDPGEEDRKLNHFGLITSVSAKKIPSGASSRSVGLSKGFLRGSGGLLLSSGVDWSVKLWAPAYNDKPLMSWVSHSYDYMSDVQWSPTHPSLFATASSNGTLGLWNLASSLEEPITGSNGIVVDSDGGSGNGLNKLKWSLDGRRLVVASGDRVHVLSLSEEVIRQKGDEDARIMSHLVSRGILERE